MASDISQKAKAAKLLAEGVTIRRTADAVGVHPQTVLRWKREDPDFNRAVADARGAIDETITGFGMLVPKSLNILNDALDGKKVPATVVRAALEIAKAAAALSKVDEKGATLEDRLAELGGTDSD